MNETIKNKIIAFCNSAMIQKERNNKEKFWSFNEETEFKPYWKKIKDILFNAGFEIEESYYRFLSDAFNDIGDYLKSEDDLKGFEDALYEYVEADIYNGDLLKWVSESLNNAYYVDEAIKEYGINNDFSLFTALQMGQQRHKEDVYFMALSVVKMLLEVEEDEE